MDKLQHSLVMKILALVLILSPTAGFGGSKAHEACVIRLTVVYNNPPFDDRLETAWGFFCLIEGTEQVILFETGGDGRILLGNMRLVGIDPLSVKMVFLSHIHGEHTGGLEGFLRCNPHVTVSMPQSFPASFQRAVASYGAKVHTVDTPVWLFGSVHSGGEMGESIREQALIVETTSGLVIITGCAHPGIVNVVREAKTRFKNEISLVMGGFHLGGKTRSQIRATIDALKGLGVKRVAPSHCTGEMAMALFREAWGEGFLEGGAGAVIEVPR
jgi:7,8-dihydropterin-6-yl-methyl-4-(beta-D-ribofuranosyl)aminobenzene 5'-phosphate synthase